MWRACGPRRYQPIDNFKHSYGWFGAQLDERPIQDPSCHANVIVFFTSTLVIAAFSLVFTIGHPWRRPFITNCAPPLPSVPFRSRRPPRAPTGFAAALIMRMRMDWRS